MPSSSTPTIGSWSGGKRTASTPTRSTRHCPRNTRRWPRAPSNKPATEFAPPPESEQGAKVELVGFAPVNLGAKPKAGDPHGLVVLIGLPQDVAFATIYNNQVWTIEILAAATLVTLVFGWFFGLWFIRPF